jgi:hypothetical protein
VLTRSIKRCSSLKTIQQKKTPQQKQGMIKK